MVEVAEAVNQQLLRFRQTTTCSAEAGGVLLGRELIGSGHLVVDALTVPTRADRRSRFFFWRDKETTQEKIDAAWRESLGARNYLGEWHTHPEAHPTPSSADRSTWTKIAKRAVYESSRLVFVIVGIESTRAWGTLKVPCELAELAMVVDDDAE